ncbi:MAG: glycosyltransferase [Flavipsychrobacter sp.]|nr:glycosyltransferase [Flavipsychrobacter sp.]
MKNVLIIGSELGGGGAQRSFSLLSLYLEKLGYGVTLCIISGTDRTSYYETCKDILFIDPPVKSSRLAKVSAWRYRIKKLKELKKERRIDVSISFLEGPDYANVLSRGKEKVVLSIRGSKAYDKVIAGWAGKVRKKILIPFLYRKADEIVCVSSALADELHRYFNLDRNRLRTIYNFYENDRIVAQSREPLTEEEQKIFSRPVIVTSGRLHVSKAQDSLLRILARVKGTINARLMILGQGELKSYLENLAGELGLKVCDWTESPRDTDADVYFMGYQHNAFKYYRHSRLFALSSSWEGFPNVFAEALICDLPVVSTDCYTGPREILNIHGLTTQTEDAHRTSIGSLLPMLDKIDEKRFDTWAKEIVYWLQAPKPTKEDFEKLTNRFTRDEMLKKWVEVVENKTP